MQKLNSLKYKLLYVWEKLLPWFYMEVIEIKVLKEMYDWLFRTLMTQHEKTINNNNPYLADEYGIYLYELIYDIKSAPSEDLEIRRWRVINHMNLQPPYTYLWLINKYLDGLIGAGNYKISRNVQGNVLTIVLNKELEHIRKEIAEFICLIKPASLLLELKLDYNTLFTFWPYRFYELYPYTIFQLKTSDFEKNETTEFGTRYNQTFNNMYWHTFLNISYRQEYKNVSVVNSPQLPSSVHIVGTTGQRTFLNLAGRSFNEISKRQEYKNVNMNGEE